jgi:hypothetical protein
MFDPEVVQAMKGFGPSDEDKQKAMNMGFLHAGLGMLAGNRGFGSSMALSNALGAGGIHGLNAYDRQINDTEKDMARQLQAAQMAQGLVRQQKLQQALQSTPGLPDEVKSGLVPYHEYWKNKNQAYNLAPGEVRMAGNVELAKGAPKLPEGFQLGPDGQLQVIPAWLQGKKEIAAAGRAVSNTNVFNNTKDDFKNERDLRNDFAGLPTTKAFNEVQSAYDQINVALKKESPAGDLAAATKIMKILDPGSVVRESELGMAMAATGALDRIENYAKMTLNGTKLTPKQRQDFGELSKQLYGAAADRYDLSAKEYQGVAKDYNLNPGRVAKPSQRSALSSGGWSATVVEQK